MSETFVSHLQCAMTGRCHEAGRPHTISADGWPLLVRYDLARLARRFSRDDFAAAGGLWHWAPLLPVARERDRISLGEAATPLVPLERGWPGAAAGELLVKDEGRLPTGSFKARGLALAVAMARGFGLSRLAIASNGNAGAALAAYARRAGLEAFVLCPDDTPEVVLREIGQLGARVWKVNGLIDDCARLVAAGREAAGWFDVSTLKEPYRIEGKKTMGLELACQLGWRLPDAIFYPTGGGTGLIGMWKAFAELRRLGWLQGPLPRMVAVQAAGCAPLVEAWRQGRERAAPWPGARTVAAGIRVPAALGDFLILRAIRESGGFALAVEDQEIVAARDAVARENGLLLCPEGAATVAAWCRARRQGRVAAGWRTVLFNCASGLKYPMAAEAGSLDKDGEIDFSRLA